MKYDVLRVEAASVDAGIKKLRREINKARQRGWKEYDGMNIVFSKGEPYYSVKPVCILSQTIVKS